MIQISDQTPLRKTFNQNSTQMTSILTFGMLIFIAPFLVLGLLINSILHYIGFRVFLRLPANQIIGLTKRYLIQLASASLLTAIPLLVGTSLSFNISLTIIIFTASIALSVWLTSLLAKISYLSAAKSLTIHILFYLTSLILAIYSFTASRKPRML